MSVFHIREACQNDVVGIAKVRVDTWRAAYKGIVPDDFIESLSYQSTAEGRQKAFWEKMISEVGYGWEEIRTAVQLS